MPNPRLASALTLPLVFTLLQGCLATLPDPVYTTDSDIFKADHGVNQQEAQSCGTHLNDLRTSARNNNYFRLGTTILAGGTTTVSSYLAATSEGDTAKKNGAIVALVSGLVTILAQAIPDPTGALDDHRKAQSSFSEARRRVANGSPADSGQIFGLLSDCRNNKSYEAAPGVGAPPAAKPPAAAQPEGTPHAVAAAAVAPGPVAAWYGFEKSKNKDRETELKNKCAPSFQRVEVPEGTKTFTGLCTSLGMRCEKACDWEGKSVECDDLPNPQFSGDGPDGSRVAHCVP
jgi:hypothetical protein